MIKFDLSRKTRAIDEAALLNRISEYGCQDCKNRCADKNGGACESCYLTAVEQWISEQETAEEKTAHWDISCDGYYPFCSVCGEEPPGREMSRYCPNCGRKMVTPKRRKA